MRRLTASLAAVVLALTGGRLVAEPAVLSLARAYLGPESTIDAIRNIHYVGTLERSDPAHPDGPPISESLDMILAKPMQQKLVEHGAKFTLTTVLDDMDGWELAVDNANAKSRTLIWMKPADILTLQANTLENLYYYHMPRGRGTAVDKGPATVDGVTCERIDIEHGDGIVFERYFDRDTGRLVLTKVGPEEIRESGEIMVEGLRFPSEITTKAAAANGKVAVAKAKFTRISINEALPRDTFAVPDMLPPSDLAAPAK
ncbi:MAG TPA: hypothetical protein VGG34_05915 [Opitutaceae bacterium]|jgi:hypothetical protein